MVTAMATGMDTAMGLNARKRSIYLAVFFTSSGVLAADVQITPSVEGELVYTDNVDSSASNKRTSEITTLTGAISIEVDGNGGNLSLDYDVQQLLYSHDSDKNELINTLSFSADKDIYGEAIRADANASISNVARSIEDNANDDVITGDTIETKSADAGITFQSNPNKLTDLYTRFFTSVTDNEDDIGNSTGYGAQLDFDNGDAAKWLFWESSYSYSASVGHESGNTSDSQTSEAKIGMQQEKGFTPFVRIYYDEAVSAAGDRESSKSWGPGIRYYWHRNTYAEVVYNFDLEDSDENYWSGVLSMNPNERLNLEFEYTQRLYGEAYDLTLEHTSRRLTNTITYNEEITNFDRTLFTTGSDIEEQNVTRTLSWESSLALRRGDASVSLRSSEQESVRSTGDTGSQSYGSKFSLTHNLSRKMKVSGSFDYSHYEFDATSQVDHYRTWQLDLERDFAQDLSFDIGFQHTNRASTNSGLAYKENRVSVSLRKEL